MICMESRQSVYHWLRVVRVCRLWRNIVLATPSLFSYVQIPTKSPSHLQEFFRLSMQVPLHVRLYPCTRSWAELHIPSHRVQILELHGNPGCPMLPDLPMLSSLTCVPTCGSGVGPWFGNCLHDVMPTLQYLDLRTYMLGPNRLSFSLPPPSKRCIS